MVLTKKYAAVAGLLVVFMLLNHLCVPVGAALKAGCAKVDITPPIGVWLSGYGSRDKPSDGIEDELYARAMVLDDGRTRIAIVSTDLLWVRLDMTTEVRRKIKAKTGIAEQNVLLCATHTHFGPKIDRITKNWPDAPVSQIDDAYVQTLANKIVDSVFLAVKNLREAKLGVAEGHMTELSYNRRTRKPDGTVAMTFRLPPAGDDLTFGPTDPQVCILRVEDQTGRLVGTLVNFACHPVCGDRDREKFYSISADYPGYTAEVVEETEGGVCLFALGTAGNMNPIRLDRINPRVQIGKALGGEVLRRIQFVPTSSEVALKAMTKAVTLPLKENRSPDRILGQDKDKKSLITEIQALRVGDIYILGLPGEVLVEIGLEIKKQVGIENLFVISLANDAVGYVCLQQAYKEGGYEPGNGTDLVEGAGEIIIEHALALLKQIEQSR